MKDLNSMTLEQLNEEVKHLWEHHVVNNKALVPVREVLEAKDGKVDIGNMKAMLEDAPGHEITGRKLITITIGKQIVVKENNEIFIPGEWQTEFARLYKMVKEVKEKQEEMDKLHEKEKLIKLLTPPSYDDGTAGNKLI